MSKTDKEIPEEKAFGEFLDIFNKETDRGAALTAAAFLDQTLYEILKSFFLDVNESQELLEGGGAVLGTFSARINMCYCLGLIQENEYRELNIFRKIRNEFGHKWKNISFETQKINDLCFNLPWVGSIELKEYSLKARNRFNFAVVILLTDLLWRPQVIQNEKRTSKIYRERKQLKLNPP